MTTSALLFVVAALAADPPPFHTELVATYPAADSLHRTAVQEVRLRFSTAVQLSLSTVTVLGPDGVVRATDTLRLVTGSEARELSLPLDAVLGTGDYRVEWRTAGPDGHALRGDFAFQVEYEAPDSVAQPAGQAAAPDDPATADPVMTATSDAGQAGTDGRMVAALARWLAYLAMSAALGGALFRTVVLRRLGDGEGPDAFRAIVERRMAALAWLGVAGGLIALPLLLGVQAVQLFAGEGLTPSGLVRVLGSAWGGAFMLQVAGVALLALGLLTARVRARLGWLLAGAAGILLAVGAARSGHAAESGALAVGIQSVHGAAAGTWLGGLALLVLAALPASRKVPGLLSRAVDAFSPLALTAVLVVIVSGALNSWDRLDGPLSLVSTTFGRVLALKLVLFALVAALGFYNWRTIRPALRQDSQSGLLRVPASIELTLGVVVLAVTALLVALPLP